MSRVSATIAIKALITQPWLVEEPRQGIQGDQSESFVIGGQSSGTKSLRNFHILSISAGSFRHNSITA